MKDIETEENKKNFEGGDCCQGIENKNKRWPLWSTQKYLFETVFVCERMKTFLSENLFHGESRWCLLNIRVSF